MIPRGGARPRRRPDVVFEDLEAELVVYAPETHQAYLLNGTAAAIWRLCDGTHTLTEIAHQLSAAFHQPVEQIAADLQEILAQFEAALLLQPDAG